MVDIPEVARANIKVFKSSSVGNAEILQRTIAFAEANPKLVADKFYAYYRIIKDLFNLSPEEISTIKSVNEKLGTKRGADEFLEALGDKKDAILRQIRQIGDLENPKNQEGINKLTQMMNNAWTIKQSEPDWAPKDGDKRANEVIWGFVKGAENPEIDIDFSLCHGIERTLTSYYPDNKFTNHKDWLLSALNDVVALKGLKGENHEAKVLPFWSKPRPAGLGWISAQRRDSYRELLSKTAKQNNKAGDL